MDVTRLSVLSVRFFETAGIAVIVAGSLYASAVFVLAVGRPAARDMALRKYRQGLGKAILLGLELLVAADIINTVGVDPSLRSVAVLGGVVLIRTFLSFSLEVEIEGTWPWRRGAERSAGGT